MCDHILSPLPKFYADFDSKLRRHRFHFIAKSLSIPASHDNGINEKSADLIKPVLIVFIWLKSLFLLQAKPQIQGGHNHCQSGKHEEFYASVASIGEVVAIRLTVAGFALWESVVITAPF